MIVAIKSGYLEQCLRGLPNQGAFETPVFKAQNGTEKHADYVDHILKYKGSEKNYSGTKQWETVRVYARETTLDEIEQSMQDGNEDDLFRLEEYTSAVGENQTLYDNVLVEARINCVSDAQKSNLFNEKLEDVRNKFSKKEERINVIEDSCRNGATTYVLQGVFGQDVFDNQHGVSGAGLLGMCINSVLDPYAELKQVLRDERKRGRKTGRSGSIF